MVMVWMWLSGLVLGLGSALLVNVALEALFAKNMV